MKKLSIILVLLAGLHADESATINISDLKEAVYMLIQKSKVSEEVQQNALETKAIVAQYNTLKNRIVTVKGQNNDPLDNYIDSFIEKNEYLLDLR